MTVTRLTSGGKGLDTRLVPRRYSTTYLRERRWGCPRRLEGVPHDQITLAMNLPQPVIGAIAVGIPVLIIAVFFIFWDRPKQ